MPDGAILGPSNWQVAKGLLPDEILEFYKKGEYKNPIIKLENRKGVMVDPRLVELSAKNDGKFDIDENGTVVDVQTKKRPPVIIGWPFPKINAKDPKAGAKALWNLIYTINWAGSFHTYSPVNWISRDAGVTRKMALDVHFKYYDGQPPEFQKQLAENPLNILSRTMAVAREPADLNGIVSLTWRFREGDKNDQAWTYVPALRRVRPINPANRSDGFLGSDISQDDGPYWDAKPEDFKLKLVGEGYVLGSYDADGLDHPSFPTKLTPDMEVSTLIPESETGWRFHYPAIPMIAAQTDEWKSKKEGGMVAWAPVPVALALRPVWIVEAVPKNPYYLYGKQIMYIDKENFRGYWKNKYDWKGTALANWMLPESKIHKVDGDPGYMRVGGGGGVAVMNNFKQDRATVNGLPVADTEWYIQMDDKIFETDRIVRYGK